jgi:hypothetical protein
MTMGSVRKGQVHAQLLEPVHHPYHVTALDTDGAS